MPEAIAFWGLYAREYPNGSLAWYCHYDLGKLYAVAGDRETALANYRKALELSPANPRVIEMMKELGGH